MAELISEGFSASDAYQIRAGIGLLEEPKTEVIEVALASPLVTRLTVTYGASRLLASGAAPAEGMKTLTVRNLGRIAARIGANSQEKIFEKGTIIEPGETKIFKITGSALPKLYARSTGFSTILEVIES